MKTKPTPLGFRFWLTAFLGIAAFALLFAYPLLGFWRQLTLTTLLLAGIAIPPLVRHDGIHGWHWRQTAVAVGGGIASAVALYLIFAVGNAVLTWLHDGSQDAVLSIYAVDTSLSGWRVALLLLFVVGPCEELFWRGYVQRRLSCAYGWPGVMLAIGAYTIAHIASANPVLVLAAAVCGTFWSLQYRLLDNLALNVVSHALWTAAAFVWLPFA